MFAKTARTSFGEVEAELAKSLLALGPEREGDSKKYKELIDSTLVVVIAMLLLGGYVASWISSSSISSATSRDCNES